MAKYLNLLRRGFLHGLWCTLGVVLLLALGSASLALANPGDLDPSFGTDGIVTTDLDSHTDFANAVAVQADGKIVVAGRTFFNDPYGNFALVRYNPDGSLDASFGVDGVVITDSAGFLSGFSFGWDEAKALALQPDGKILLAGYALRRIPRPTPKFALARYNTDGSLDTDFGSDGKVVTDVTNSQVDLARDLALQADGKIVVAGVAGGDIALARYLGDAEE